MTPKLSLKDKLFLGAVAVSFALCGAQKPRTPTAVKINDLVRNNFSYGYMLAEKADIENAWCLEGYVSGDTLYIESTYNPFVVAAGPHHIQFGCTDKKNYVGEAHSHSARYEPNRDCGPSERDLANKNSRNIVSGIICKDTINFYSQ